MPSRASPSPGRSAGRSSTGAGRPAATLPVVCAVCAALPDIDLLVLPTHRTATHSVPVAVLVTIVAGAVTGWVRPVRAWLTEHFGEASQLVVIGLACGLACRRTSCSTGSAPTPIRRTASRRSGRSATLVHLGRGRVSGTERRNPLSTSAMLINLRAAVQEAVLMGSIAAGVVVA